MFNVGDTVICLITNQVFVIKYMLSKKPVVSNGKFDFPLVIENVVHWSPLMEELI